MYRKGTYALNKIKTEKNRIEDLFIILLYLLPLAFYLFFAFYDGVVWCADSDSYVIMHECREPLYPTFLDLLRSIFGSQKDTYLFAAVIMQSVLAAISTSILTDFLRKTCKTGRYISLLILAVPLFTSLLNRFVASRGSMYSNSILTEGIAISLFLLFMRFCMGYIITGKNSDLVIGSLLAIMGILTRKQMYIMLFLMILSIICSRFRHRKETTRVTAFYLIRDLIMTICIILASSAICDNIYNKIVHGSFHIHTEDNRFISTMAFYTAKREYVQYIPQEYRNLFLEIYDVCDSNEWVMNYAPKNWYDATSHFGDNYDHIQLDTMELIMTKHHDEWNMINMSYTEKLDVVRSQFNKALIPHEIPELSKVIFNNFLEGLVNTVAQKRRILCLYTALIYPLYIALLIYLIKKRDKNDTQRTNTLIVSFMSLTAVLLNVTIVSMVIFPQTRYTIYGMPLFYISLLVMINELIRPKDIR